MYVFEENNGQSFPNLMKAINSQILEFSMNLDWGKTKKPQKHIIIKLLKTSKKSILKATREKTLCIVKQSKNDC